MDVNYNDNIAIYYCALNDTPLDDFKLKVISLLKKNALYGERYTTRNKI